MTVLAIRLANITNGVSKLHGSVSRKMWKNIWPELPDAEMPITSITNGVHTHSWLSPDMAQLYDRYLGVAVGRTGPTDHSVWKRVENIPDAELWRTHERRRERLVAFARGRLKEQLQAPRRAAGRDRPRRRGARPRSADHRLRPPLRHLQARHADLPQPGTAGGDPQQQGSAGADHLRRQGPSQRPRRQGADRRDHARSPAGRSSAAASSSSKTTT